VENATGRIDIIVGDRPPRRDGVLQQELIRAWCHEGIAEIRFHQIEMDGGAPARDAEGRIMWTELFRKSD
jgi:hypothetical protein